ncbi:HAD hydrolase-like protein [Maribellus sp. CM-23]|uniref:HAD family hydrolase n=1 Tax=Maribellus sp. CM-23 TaxID=2781026 RepID=UPI001F44C140|nr:HAD family hydrolase [Maribellus sp. CM-23]MCE4566984.1 HAD hydrolase-like protein [Maribellus sp. CM-23]
MNKIKMVVFDMAGTTVKDDNEVEKCFTEAAQNTGLQYTIEEIVAMMGWSKRLVFETLWKKNLPDAEESEIQEKTDESYDKFRKILENHYLTQPVLPVDGAEELFSYLKKEGVIIVLTTGFYRKVTDIILQRLGWDKNLDEAYKGNDHSIIDLSVSSDQVIAGRPSPYMINKAMEVFGLNDPKQVIKIGDTPSDLEAGRNANCLLSLGVTYGTHTKEQLAKYDNDGLLNAIVELKKYLN